MANYAKGGKVGDPPVKKKVVENATKVAPRAVKEVGKDYQPNLDAEGKPILVNGHPTFKKVSVKDPEIDITFPKKNVPTKSKYAGVKPTMPRKPKVDGTPTKAEEDIVFLDETVKNTPEPDPFELAFGWRAEKKETTNQGIASNMPKVMVNGKPTQIREWTIPGRFDAKTKTWNTSSGAMNPTKVYAYYDASGKLVPFDENMSKLSYNDKGGAFYDAKDVVAPAAYTGNLIQRGSLTATDSEMTRKIEAANEEQRKNYEGSGKVAPEVKIKQFISPTNFNESGYSIGKDVNIDAVKSNIVPTQMVNTPVVDNNNTPFDNLDNYKKNAKPVIKPNMAPKEVTLPANSNPNLPSSGDNINLLYKRKKGFKSGGLVSKYGGGGPVINPQLMAGIKNTYAAGRDSGGIDRGDVIGGTVAPIDATGGLKQGASSASSGTSNTQGLGAAAEAVGQIAGTGVDALDKKDGYSTIAGQAGASALKGAGKGAAIGLNPAVMALTGGNSAWIAPIAGAVIGGTVGAVKGKKEKTERIGLAADEMRGSVADQQYSDSKDTFKSESFREQDTKRGLRGLFAKGGTIKGPGTGTSDSIEAKVKPGTFIVPAKNAGFAEKLVKELLGKKEGKMNLNQGGGVKVKLSNGEYGISEKTKNELTSYLGQEILEELAPDAKENSEEMRMGGMLKRADGSYSKRGLWDNIRANAGSGKKPTPEMLKQEKKIKDSYAGGGYVVQRSGDREGKTHKVTGPDGTVKYFGDPNLGQHPKDSARKEAFYARHKNNLDNNPHFRAYARETWAEGGTVTKYANGGNVENTTKRMTSSGNPALDAEIDLLYKTGNWRADAVDKIEAKAKALGLDVGDNPLSPSLRTGVFKDLKYKKDYFKTEVNKELQNKKQQKKYEMRRLAFAPTAPKGMNDEDFMTYRKLKKEAVSEGKGMAALQKFVADKKDSLEESNKFQGQLKRGIETGKDYAKKYQLAQDLKANLEYAKKNVDKFTAKELQSLAEQEKAASLDYSKLKTPSQYATPNNKRLDAIYEGFAKKRYKPTKVEERSAAPVLQEKIEVKQTPVVQAAAPAVTPVVAQGTQKVAAAPVKSVAAPPVAKVAPTKKKEVAVTYVDEDF